MRTWWSNKSVIVTGGSGFLGRHIVRLLNPDAKAIIVPRSKDYDLRIQEDVLRLFEDHPNVDIVIHCAASVGGIEANQRQPATYFYDNLMMGMHLIDVARIVGIHKFVTVGTVCEYPKVTSVPFRETDLWEGYPEETNAPYGIAKKALLVMGNAYRQQYHMNCIHILPTNLYGRHDNFDPRNAHVIPSLIYKFLDAMDKGLDCVTLFGDGSPTREFLHVEDAARGIVLAAQYYNHPEPINLGSGNEISIAELAHQVAQLTGYKGRIFWDASKPNGQPRRRVDNSKAKMFLDFEAGVDFHEGLRDVIAWYRSRQREQVI